MGCKHKANEAVVKTKKFRSGLKELPLQIAQFPEPQQPTERKKKIKETSPYMAKLRSSPGESPRFLGHSVSCQMTFIIKHLNVNFDRLMANCFPSRAAYKFPAADDVDDLWRGKCAAPSTNSNEPSNGQSSVFGLFIFFYFALLSLSPFIWLNRSPPELVMMSYRIDKGRIGCQVGFVRGCALTEMLRGALKISYF